MDRTVISARDAAASNALLGPNDTPVKADDYSDRLLKYIPPDVIGAYVAVQATIGAALAHAGPTPPHSLVVASWVVFGIILLATPFYLLRVAHVTKPIQISVSMAAFVVWAVAYPGLPFSGIVDPVYGALGLIVATFVIPIFDV
jgi:hypothetical protein